MTGPEELLKTLAAEEAILLFPRPVHADFFDLNIDSLKIFRNRLGLGQSTPIFFGLRHINKFVTSDAVSTSLAVVLR